MTSSEPFSPRNSSTVVRTVPPSLRSTNGVNAGRDQSRQHVLGRERAGLAEVGREFQDDALVRASVRAGAGDSPRLEALDVDLDERHRAVLQPEPYQRAVEIVRRPPREPKP